MTVQEVKRLTCMQSWAGPGSQEALRASARSQACMHACMLARTFASHSFAPARVTMPASSLCPPSCSGPKKLSGSSASRRPAAPLRQSGTPTNAAGAGGAAALAAGRLPSRDRTLALAGAASSASCMASYSCTASPASRQQAGMEEGRAAPQHSAADHASPRTPLLLPHVLPVDLSICSGCMQHLVACVHSYTLRCTTGVPSHRRPFPAEPAHGMHGVDATHALPTQPPNSAPAGSRAHARCAASMHANLWCGPDLDGRRG